MIITLPSLSNDQYFSVLVTTLTLVFSFLSDSQAQKNFENADLSQDFLSSGENYDLRSTIPGEPGIDYPIYSSVPSTNFDCVGRHEGYYADVETKCQVFRICANTDRKGEGFGFLCPNGTLFSQRDFVCDWYRNIDCSESEKFYERNSQNYIGSKSEMLETVRRIVEHPMRNIDNVLKRFSTEAAAASNKVGNKPRSIQTGGADVRSSNFGTLSSKRNISFAEKINAGLVGLKMFGGDELVAPDYVTDVVRSQRDHSLTPADVNDLIKESTSKFRFSNQNAVEEQGSPYRYEKPGESELVNSLNFQGEQQVSDMDEEDTLSTTSLSVKEIFASIGDSEDLQKSSETNSKAKGDDAETENEFDKTVVDEEAQRLLLAGLHLSINNIAEHGIDAIDESPTTIATSILLSFLEESTTEFISPSNLPATASESVTTPSKPLPDKLIRHRRPIRRYTINPNPTKAALNPPIYKRALPTTPKITTSTKPPKYSTTKRRLNRVIANLYRDALRIPTATTTTTVSTENWSTSKDSDRDLSALASTYENSVRRPPHNTLARTSSKYSQHKGGKYDAGKETVAKKMIKKPSRYRFARLRVRPRTIAATTPFPYKNISSTVLTPTPNSSSLSTHDSDPITNFSAYLSFEKLTQAILDDSVLQNFRNNQLLMREGNKEFESVTGPVLSQQVSFTFQKPQHNRQQQNFNFRTTPTASASAKEPSIVIATGRSSQFPIFTSNYQQTTRPIGPQYIPLNEFLTEKFGSSSDVSPDIRHYQYFPQSEYVDTFSRNHIAPQTYTTLRPQSNIGPSYQYYYPSALVTPATPELNLPANARQFPTSINVPIPTTIEGIIPNPRRSYFAQRRIDTLEDSMAEGTSLYEGPSSYEVPLASVGPVRQR